MLPTVSSRPDRGRWWTMLAAVLLLAALCALPARQVRADGGGGDDVDSRNPHHVEAVALIKKESFADAEQVLRKWVGESPESADAHNLLGYVARKQGRLQEAVGHYREALRLDPKHRGAHEYLGETWLALDDLVQAKVHLAFLDDDCWLPCEQYSDLKDAVERYEQGRRR